MAIEQDRKKLAKLQAEHAEYSAKLTELQTKQKLKEEDAKQAKAAAEKFGREAKEVQRKLTSCATQVSRVQSSIEKAEKAAEKRARS